MRTEERVTERLREVLDGTTTLIVAHRPSTVALADRVALLRAGRIEEVGTHAELLASSPGYRRVMSTAPEPDELVRDGDPTCGADAAGETPADHSARETAAVDDPCGCPEPGARQEVPQHG